MAESLEQWLEELLNQYDGELKMTEKQIKILQAAVETFAEKGYAATSTSEIAKRAEVAEGTIFRHYKTKKDLLLSIVAPTMAKLMAPFVLKDITKVIDTPYPSFEDFLRAMAKNRFEFAKKNQPILKILLQEIPFHQELKEQFWENVAKQVLERVTAVVEHYQKEGQLIPIPPVTAFRLAFTSIIGFLFLRFVVLPEHEWDDQQELEDTDRKSVV